jgi:protein-tyrosine phosphatase
LLTETTNTPAEYGTDSRSDDRGQKTVLFLCTGNYYRSRFAEILFNWLAAGRQLAWRADSRGLDPDPRNDGPISRHTVAACQRLSIPLDGQRFPRRAEAADFQRSHHVVAVKEAEHRPLLERSFPSVVSRVEFWQVHDLDCAEPDEALPQLQRLVEELLNRLAGPGKADGNSPPGKGNAASYQR